VLKKRAFLTVTLLGLVPFGAQANVHPSITVPHGRNFDASHTALSPRTAKAPGSAVALARSPGRDVPTMLVSPSAAVPAAGLTAEEAARFHLTNLRGEYRVPKSALTGMRLRFVHDTGRGGIIVALRQLLAGVEVFHGDVKVLLDRRDHRLLGVAGAPHPAAVPGNRQLFTLTKPQAITSALTDLYGASTAAVSLRPNGQRRGGWEHFEVAGAGSLKFREPARVKPVYFPLGDALVPAWFVEVQVRRGRGQVDAYQHVVAADDGRLLYRRNLTDDDQYKYRVWAEPGGDRQPLDGPYEDWTPHPTGLPDFGPTEYTVPTLVQLEGTNHNANDQPDPWLPVGATETRGNNADAYVDWNTPDGLNTDIGEFRAPVSGNKAFDYIYDPNVAPLANSTQANAAIVQLFYDVNWLHDWWYDSGFVEATGNAQFDNYGRGGLGEDGMKAEAQDGAITPGSRNNANMSTPEDGMQPRMQMFLWTARTTATLDINPGLGEVAAVTSRFGVQTFDLTGDVVLIQDAGGPGTLTDGCEAIVNDVAGKVALIDRGVCSFEIKVKSAEAAGAIGAIVANNQLGNIMPSMGADNTQVDPTIPSVGITQNSGVALKAALLAGVQSAHMTSVVGVERDGTIDNMIVAHEFGHYLHHRLQNCGSAQCGGMSEGWGDFNALMQALREGDDLDGVYAMGTYATFDTTGFFSIRRGTYSTDMTKNALTFKNVTDGVPLPVTAPIVPNGLPNAQVHNTGELWASTMWEGYIALLKAHLGPMTHSEVTRLMSDYVVGGLMMTGVDPTFTQTRDAILMAANANDPADTLVLATAYAKRGMGSCAVSPPVESTTFAEVVEDFTLAANGVMTSVPTMSDDILSCDDDGLIDVGEIGTIRVQVTNVGVLSLPKGSEIEIVGASPNMVFPEGPLGGVGALEPFQSVEVAIKVQVDDTLVDRSFEEFTVRLNTPDGCTAFSERGAGFEINADLSPNSSSVDDVEATTSAWTIGGALGETVWARELTPGGFQWHGADLGTVTNATLTSPPLEVSPTDPLVISFEHRHKFEFSGGIYWDGGLVEVSTDGGMNWEDAANLGANPSYIGTIANVVNPIDGMLVYADVNAAYPATEVEVLDFGQALAGQSVLFRFRIGTDGAAGDLGWDIDNIEVEGITNTPFNTMIPDQAVCTPEETTGETGDTTAGSSSTTSDETTAGSTTTGTGSSGSESSSSSSGTTEGVDTTDGTSSTSTTEPPETTVGPTDTSDSAETTVNPPETTVNPETGDSDSQGSTPTTSDTNPDPTNPPDDEEDSGDDESTDPGEQVDDEGCGCTTADDKGWGWQFAPWLALLGLGRRRRRA
jgi:MYXO-CTERM domain-containing protein